MEIFSSPGSLNDFNFWENVEESTFKVRAGKNYRTFGKKSESKKPYYDVVAVDAFKTDRTPFCVGEVANLAQIKYQTNPNPSEKNFKSPLNSLQKQNDCSNSPKSSSQSPQKIQKKETLKTTHNEPKKPSSKPRKLFRALSRKISGTKEKEKDRENGMNLKELPEWFIVTILVPGSQAGVLLTQKSKSTFFVIYARRNDETVLEAHNKKEPSLELLRHFISGLNPPTSKDKDIRKRFKVITKALNLKDINLPNCISGLLEKYNGKPFMARSSTTFYSGENYFEINVNINKFGYLSQFGLNGIRSYIRSLIVAFGVVVQSETDEEMPERLILCFKAVKMDFGRFPSL